VIASIFAFFLPIAVFYQRIEGILASKMQLCMFCFIAAGDFVAFMVWVCIFTVNATPGWALYVNIVVFSLAIAAAFVSFSWKSHCEAAQSQSTSMSTTTSSTPMISTPEKSTPVAKEIPKSYPSSSAAVAVTTPAASVRVAATIPIPTPKPKVTVTYPKKWGDWEEIYDQENQAWYFFNHSNGESAWDRPQGWPSN
jgi:hypothetical protein